MKKYLIKINVLIVLLILSISPLYAADFIPEPAIKAPVTPEIYNYQSILSKFGKVNKQTCDLNIVVDDITLPGKGLLPLKITRSYSSKMKLEQVKSSDKVRAYADYTMKEAKYYSFKAMLRFTRNYTEDFMNDENYGKTGLWYIGLINFFTANHINKIQDAEVTSMRDKINFSFNMNSKNPFINKEQKHFGNNWLLSINGFNRIFIQEFFNQDNSYLDNLDKNDWDPKYYWEYKALVGNDEHEFISFEKNYKGDNHGSYSTDPDKYSDLKNLYHTNNVEWDLSGYKMRTIKNDDVIKKMNYKFKYDKTNDEYILILSSGIKYIFSKIQNNIYYKEKNDYDDLKLIYIQRMYKKIAYLTKIEDKYGNYISINYDSDSYEISDITDSKGNTIEFIYSDGKIEKIQYTSDSGIVDIEYNYDEDNNLIEAKNKLDQSMHYVYSDDEYNQLIEARNDFGTRVEYTYDFEENIGLQADLVPNPALVNYLIPDPKKVLSRKIVYDNEIKVHEKIYNKVTYYEYKNEEDTVNYEDDFLNETYDYRNSVVLVGEPLEGDAFKETIFTYNNIGQLSKTRNPLGYETIYKYKRGTNYYNVPVEILKKVNARQNGTNINEELNRTENYYDDQGLLDYSLLFKADNNIHYIKKDYEIIPYTNNEYFFYRNENIEILNSQDNRLRFTKAFYNDMNDIIEIKKWLDPDEITTKEITYSTQNPWQIIEIKDGENISTIFGYDTDYYLSSIANLIYTENFEYYPISGNLKKITDKNNNITEIQYDVLNRIIQVKQTGIDIVMDYIYDDTNYKTTSVKKFQDTPLVTSEISYNIFRKPVLEKNIDNGNGKVLEIKYEYKKSGNLLRKIENSTANEVDKLTTIYMKYDGLNRPLHIILPNGMEEYYTYLVDDVNDVYINTVHNSLKEKTIEHYDYLNNLVRKSITKIEGENPKKYITEYEYDELSQLKKIVQNPANDNPIIFEKSYDSLGRLISSIEPGNIITEYSYLNNDKILTYENPNGTYTHTYDSIGRLERLQLPSDPELNYYYDDESDGNKGKGMLTKIERAGISSSSFLYGDYDRKLKDIKHINELSRDYITEYQYNSIGNIEKVILPDAKEINYNTDNSGRVNSIIYNGKSLCSYQYNNFDSVIKKQYNDNAIVSDYERYKNIYIKKIDCYDSSDHQEKYLYFEYNYKYDYLQSYKDFNDNSVSFFYDDITGMLKDVAHSDGSRLSYTYDDFFNRSTYVHNFGKHNYSYETGNNRLDFYELNEKVNAKVDFSYDSLGNASKEEYKYNNNVREEKTYIFDNQNQLISVSLKKYPENNKLPTIQKTVDYMYDENNMLLKRNNGIETKYYLYSESGSLQAEMDSSGDIIKSHINGECVIDNSDATEKIFYHIKDFLGNICSIVDESNKRIQFNMYDPFGNIEHSTGESDNNFKFTGKEVDADTGLHYFGARWYDSTIGRFISVDPIILPNNPKSLNLYIYSFNNPLKYTDPDGRTVILIGLQATGGGGFAGTMAGGIAFDFEGNIGLFGNIGGGTMYGLSGSIDLLNVTIDWNSENLPEFNKQGITMMVGGSGGVGIQGGGDLLFDASTYLGDTKQIKSFKDLKGYLPTGVSGGGGLGLYAPWPIPWEFHVLFTKSRAIYLNLPKTTEAIKNWVFDKVFIKHKMQKGDTIWDLGKKYNVDYEKILELNQIQDPTNISVDKDIYIPKINLND